MLLPADGLTSATALVHPQLLDPVHNHTADPYLPRPIVGEVDLRLAADGAPRVACAPLPRVCGALSPLSAAPAACRMQSMEAPRALSELTRAPRAAFLQSSNKVFPIEAAEGGDAHGDAASTIAGDEEDDLSREQLQMIKARTMCMSSPNPCVATLSHLLTLADPTTRLSSLIVNRVRR